MNKEVIVLGAGAAGLMTARELAIAGKETLILEARERIGGRIWPLLSDTFGYNAQGGAEFVHGEAHVTMSLIRQAGLTLLPLNGEVWRLRGSQLSKSVGGPTNDPLFLPHKDKLHEQLRALTDDISIAQFLERHFREDKDIAFRDWIRKMVEGYEAADLSRMSTFALREGWLNGEAWLLGRIKEGYGALLEFLESECRTHGVELRLNQEAKTIHADLSGIHVSCKSGYMCRAQQVVVTLPLPVQYNSLRFIPAFPEKTRAASQIGFGHAMKFLLQFRTNWWEYALGQDLTNMMFVHCDETIPTWWTQYPESYPVLTGWLAGPQAEKVKNYTTKQLLDIAITSLAKTFQVREDFLHTQLLASKIVNWSADPLAQGAYSYVTPEFDRARETLVEPVHNQIFFAGEALCSGKDSATVEGALASGKETAERMLQSSSSQPGG
jgi:monoamine oxidase